MKLTFSVVTVCFNNAATIKATLDSLATQTWRDFEHIIIDGASNDATAAIVTANSQPHTRWFSEPDAGIYDAMNKGVARTTGDIVCFLNADDYYAGNNVLASVADCFADSELDAVFGDVGFFQSDDPAITLRRYDSGRFSPERIAWGWMPAHPATFVRREIYQRVGPFRTDYKIAGDFEWIARAFHGGRLRYRHVPQILVRMRMGGVSTRDFGSSIKLNREILRACRENGIYTNPLMLLAKIPRKMLELVWK